MKNIVAVVGGLVLSVSLGSSTVASSYEQKMSHCLTKHANVRDSASVMLECNAANGRLSDCKVVSESATGKGFDKAALCVAEVLPIGSKTGVVKVPVRFPGS